MSQMDLISQTDMPAIDKNVHETAKADGNHLPSPGISMASKAKDDTTEIDLIQLFKALKKKIVWVLLAAILGGCVAGLFTHFFVTPKYKAKSMVFLVSASSSVLNLSDLQLSSGIAEDYASMIKSRSVLLAVADNLHLDYSYAQMCEIVSVENPTNTHILNIYATCPDPAQAKSIADEAASVSIAKIAEVMEISEPNVIDRAVLPTAPDSPNLFRNMVIGVLVGMCLIIAWVVLRVVLDRTVKSIDDIEKYCGLVTLAKVYDAKDVHGGYGHYQNNATIHSIGSKKVPIRRKKRG